MAATLKRETVKALARRRRALRNTVRTLSIGLGGCLALNGHYYNKRLEKIINTSDEQALRSDWKAIGDDMRSALNNLKIKS